MSKRALPILAATAIVFGAACGTDGSTSPNDGSRTVDVAAVVSQIATGGLSAYPGLKTTVLNAGTPPAIPAGVLTNCPYSAASQAFVCPAYTSSGITFTVSYSLFDASGHALTQIGATGIASIRTIADLSGTTTSSTDLGPSTTTSEQGHIDMTMSGLTTDAQTLNGTSTVHGDAAAGALHALVDIKTVTTNLVTSSASQWPRSGSIAADVSTGVGAGPGTATGVVHAVATFNGTNAAQVTSSVNGGTPTTCTVNLVTGALACS